MSEKAFLEPTMIPVHAGEFWMGSDVGLPNERPVHRVWVELFGIACTAVTRREYSLFLQATGRSSPPFWDDPKFQQSDQPVVGVNWYDAVAYCEWLAECTSKPYRLPTEAEREKAALGGQTGIAYPWGQELPKDHKGGRHSAPELVGLDQPNGYGLHNMADGVHEWCSDWYDARYYERSPEQNPGGPAMGQRRAARGGSWRHAVRFTRCSARSSLLPDRHFSDFGFRCAISLPA